MPFQFGLLDASNPPEYISVAAFIFQEVVRDLSLSTIYGDSEAGIGADLKWLPELSSAHLIVSIVRLSQEDKGVRVIKIMDMYTAAGFDQEIEVNDNDISVLDLFQPSCTIYS